MAQNEFNDGNRKYGDVQARRRHRIPKLVKAQDDLQSREHQPHEDEHEQQLEVDDAEGRDSCGQNRICGGQTVRFGRGLVIGANHVHEIEETNQTDLGAYSGERWTVYLLRVSHDRAKHVGGKRLANTGINPASGVRRSRNIPPHSLTGILQGGIALRSAHRIGAEDGRRALL